MANLTNSSKLIAKIEEIDGKIGSLPEGVDIAEELESLQDQIGTLPEDKDVVTLIGEANAAAEAAQGTADGAQSAAEAAQGTADTAVANAATAQAAAEGAQSTADTAVANAATAQAAAEAAQGDVDALEQRVDELKTSDLENDGDGTNPFITKTVTALDNFYDKDEVNSLVQNFEGFEIVTELPTENIKTNVIYMVGPKASATGPDKYDEYVRSGNEWIMIGDTTVDLSNYYNKDEIDGKLEPIAADAAEGKAAKEAVDEMGDIVSHDEDDFVASDAKYSYKTVTEGTDGKVAVADVADQLLAAEVAGLSTATGNLATAHNNVVDRVADVEEAISGMEGSLPATLHFLDVTLNGKVTTVTDSNITATSHVSFVVKSGTLAGFALEKEVEAGKLTITSSDAESATLEVLIINKKSS